MSSNGVTITHPATGMNITIHLENTTDNATILTPGTPDLRVNTTCIFQLSAGDVSFKLEPSKAAYYILLLRTPQGISYNNLSQYETNLMKFIAS